ncbi:hypothetical protein RH449_000244 [Providencia stuartii]|uniref:hypothetical protein n=1 Tax=Providencia stuartii TaxID=588 RepID=UPI0028826DE1|nr:hypothetical protein [Providencia stuartii]MDK7736153.1 hypothetical protein [Providencia stuartii]HEM6842851.1 hypothetical protein [Providencia stuartii]HEM8345436.1 hypothetical protein [Providencia stuartii]
MGRGKYFLYAIFVFNSLFSYTSLASNGVCDIKQIKEFNFNKPLENFKYGYLSVNNQSVIGCRFIVTDKISNTENIVYYTDNDSNVVCSFVSDIFFSSTQSGIITACNESYSANAKLSLMAIEVNTK